MKKVPSRWAGIGMCGAASIGTLMLVLFGPWKEAIVTHTDALGKKFLVDEGAVWPWWARLTLLAAIMGALSRGVWSIASSGTPGRKWSGVALCGLAVMGALALSLFAPWKEKLVVENEPAGAPGLVLEIFHYAPYWSGWARISVFAALLGVQGGGVVLLARSRWRQPIVTASEVAVQDRATREL